MYETEFELDLTIIWDIIKKNIPKTKRLVEKMSNELDEEEEAGEKKI